MEFEKFSPHLLRFAIEKELQITDDTKIASMTALKRLKKDPKYYHKKYGYIEMGKARPTKYISKKPDGKGGWIYKYKEKIKKNVKEKPKNQTETPEFKVWFGDSKVIDENDKPLVVYHGTNKDFKEFDVKKTHSIERRSDYVGKGIFFTKNIETAEKYSIQAKLKTGETTINIKPVYLKIENPLIINNYEKDMKKVFNFFGDEDGINYFKIKKENPENIQRELIKRGYDGLIDNLYGQYAVFKPNQIKSAIGNRGTFDPNSADMTKARSTKYLSKKPDGKGGWIYVYKQDGKERKKPEGKGDKEKLFHKYMEKEIDFDEDLLGKIVVGYRYGKAPESGYSWNYAENKSEPGISMAKIGHDDESNLFAVLNLKEKKVKKYYYLGEISGTGGDDEVVLTNLKEISQDDFIKKQNEPMIIDTVNKIIAERGQGKLFLLKRGWNIGETKEGIIKKIKTKLKQISNNADMTKARSTSNKITLKRYFDEKTGKHRYRRVR
jgi:hypothetical protein